MTKDYRQYIEQAKKLPQAELERHAQISTANRCRCLDCFTCACEHARYQREFEQPLRTRLGLPQY